MDINIYKQITQEIFNLEHKRTNISEEMREKRLSELRNQLEIFLDNLTTDELKKLDDIKIDTALPCSDIGKKAISLISPGIASDPIALLNKHNH